MLLASVEGLNADRPFSQKLTLQAVRIMCLQIRASVFTAEPYRQKMIRLRKAVHFGEQGHDKGAEAAEGLPVCFGFRLGKAGEDNDEWS